jgi:hypothetical protein
VASTQATSVLNESSFKVAVNFALILLGFEHYQSTPLAVATSSFLAQGINQLNVDVDRYPWEGMIIAEDGPGWVAMNAGVDADVHVGDLFELRNAEHLWDGLPCQSAYDRARVERTPSAIGRVTDVAAGDSWLEIQPNPSNRPVVVGAKATLRALAQ